MHHAKRMLETHPHPSSMDREALASCVHACFDCEQTCTACADACLAEDMVAELRRCIRLNLDCADICGATGRLLSRQTEPNPAVLRAQLEACVEACRQCARECGQHMQKHEHCRVCADACRECEGACLALLQAA